MAHVSEYASRWGMAVRYARRVGRSRESFHIEEPDLHDGPLTALGGAPPAGVSQYPRGA